MNVYLASSWRNGLQPAILAALRAAGHEVYDFRNPAPGNSGFGWKGIDDEWLTWTPEQFRQALDHPVARAGFRLDMDALRACDACVLLLPCGRSAHLELGWAAGAGKVTAALMLEPSEPELMYSMLGAVCTSLPELVAFLSLALPPPCPEVHAETGQRCEGHKRSGDYLIHNGGTVTWVLPAPGCQP